jgi:competence protein ComEA
MAGSAPAASAAPSPSSSTATTTAADLVVHAAGAVAVPGVHRVPGGSRVADLLVAAGGPAPDADLDRVNLAAPLTDGERVWIPRVGEEAPPVVAGTPPAPAPGGDGAGGAPGAAAGPVDLNTATAVELDTLPGVGPATAAAIIEHRERAGPFRSVDDLLDVPGIGDAKLAQLRDLVVV